jgi:hypothetical protein
MAHYAILDENNIVTDVIVGKDENEPLPEGYSSWEEYYGGKRTSYNTVRNSHLEEEFPFRKNYAGIGYKYDEQFDAFIAPQPFDSWKFNYTTFTWVSPSPKPEHEDGYVWLWSEVNQEWVKVPLD